MNITWVTRSFLDYRIPLYAELNRLCNNNLTVIYNAEVVPERCKSKLSNVLGAKSIGLYGEFRLSGKKIQPLSNIKKNGLRIPYQPKLVKIIKKTEPDVIITDGFFQWTYAALILNFTRKIPHVMCYEGTEHTERNAGLLRLKFRKFASSYINLIHANGTLSSAFLKNVLKLSDSKISTGNMTSETELLKKKCSELSEKDAFKIKNDLDLKTNVFLFVGRLVPLKGVQYLVEAWSELNLNDSSLLLVGDGTERDELEKLIEVNNIKDVCFKGEIDYDEIYKYFGISDCFIIPTLQDNWSLVVPEAMSCNLPIISSKYNGCWPELVTKENGWVFNPLDKINFIQTLNEVIEKKDEWITMGKASSKIVENFSPKIIANKIYNSCKSLT